MDMINIGLGFATQNFEMPNLNYGNMMMPQMPDMMQYVTGGLGALENMVPGIGTQAFDIPEMPPFEYFMDLQSMQGLQTREKTEFSEAFKGELQAKIDKVFDHFHYQYDSNGNPVMENGRPKLFEGPEDPQSRGQRIKYESNTRDQLRSQQNAELDAINTELKQIVKEMQQNPETTMDPTANEARQARLNELEARQKALESTHDQEVFNRLYGHLPDPETTVYSSRDVVVTDQTNTNVTETNSVDNNTTTTTTVQEGTVTNEDGTTVTTVVNDDGSVTTTTVNADGTQTAVTDDGNGTITTTVTNLDGTSNTTTTTSESTTVNNTTVVDTHTTTVIERQDVADISNARPLSNYIDNNYSEYRQMEARHTSESNNSEAGRAIAEYQAAMADFTRRQYEMINYVSQNQDTLFDPSAYYDVGNQVTDQNISFGLGQFYQTDTSGDMTQYYQY